MISNILACLVCFSGGVIASFLVDSRQHAVQYSRSEGVLIGTSAVVFVASAGGLLTLLALHAAK